LALGEDSMKTAVCTLVVGNRFERLFRNYVFQSWRNYCNNHDYELIVFRKLLADLPGKSPSWQKLFILEQPELKGFGKIIWLDADIIIRRSAPPIEVPAGRVGYVQDRPPDGIAAWYEMFSMAPSPDIVQGGVLCLEPAHHEILQQAVNYPETSMYEMPALSACVSQSNVGYHLDPRFNALPATLMLDYAPRWMLTTKLVKELLWQLHCPPLRRAVREVCEKNWFIHAAGAKRDLIKVNKQLEKLEASAR
jgi:hypothetical protein